MRRRVNYQWRLRLVMAEHGMFATTELVPLLADRGIELCKVFPSRILLQNSMAVRTLAGALQIRNTAQNKYNR
jgi:hypothetical protein